MTAHHSGMDALPYSCTTRTTTRTHEQKGGGGRLVD